MPAGELVETVAAEALTVMGRLGQDAS